MWMVVTIDGDQVNEVLRCPTNQEVVTQDLQKYGYGIISTTILLFFSLRVMIPSLCLIPSLYLIIYYIYSTSVTIVNDHDNRIRVL
jgi:hypothetical protein